VRVSPGAAPKLGRKQWSVLGLLSVAELFDHYDVGIMSMALTQIQAGLGIPEEDLGGILAFTRLGSLLAIAISVMADRFGRRRLLLLTILGFTLSTFATAFAQTAEQFMMLQLIARIFITGETLLAVVVLTEELAARDRGWGIGILGALGSLGHGLAAIVFAFVDVLPFGWRALYLIGVIPLLFLSYFRRRLPETARFERHRAERGGRVGALGFAVLPFDFVAGSAYAFMPKTLQDVHDYSPAQVMAIFILGGAVGVLGNVFAGAMGDRFGRRPVLTVSVATFALSIVGFYNTSGPVLPLLWVASIFSVLASGVLFKALGAELFPTSHRSTASGVRGALSTIGAMSGLWLEGVLYSALGSHALAITAMTPALLIPPLVVGFFMPETAQLELEEVSPER